MGAIAAADDEETPFPAAAPRRSDPVRVEVRGLSKSFGPVQAVSDLSFTVEPGSVTGFLGPNGAGKTTTLRMVLGLMHPDAGTATFDGTPVRGAARARCAPSARSSRRPSTRRAPAATTCASTAAPPGFPLSRADEVLVQVGLADAGDRRAGGYSLGMRQRLALATALLGDPAVLVLDEPANGLDPEGIQWLRGFLRHLAHEQGRTVLVSSHLLSEVEQTVDRVVIVGAGRLVREGSMEQLRSGADGAGTRARPQPRVRPARRACCAPAGTHRRPRTDGDLTVTGSTPAEVGRRAFAAGIELHELRPHTSGLEEIYFQLTAGQEQFAAPPAGHPTVAQEATR